MKIIKVELPGITITKQDDSDDDWIEKFNIIINNFMDYGEITYYIKLPSQKTPRVLKVGQWIDMNSGVPQIRFKGTGSGSNWLDISNVAMTIQGKSSVQDIFNVCLKTIKPIFDLYEVNLPEGCQFSGEE